MIAYVLEAPHAPHEVDFAEGPKRDARLFRRVFVAREAAEGASAFFAKLQPTFSVSVR